jgi:uncharacterized membrane protein HdeD (DUF308 family)
MAGYRQFEGDGATTGPLRVADAGTVSVAAGALSIVIGLLILIWPGPTVVVLAWLFAIQLVVAGVLQLVAAFAGDTGSSARVLLGLLGALSILVGLLCLRAPLQTAVVLGLLVGATWVVSGVIGIVAAMGSSTGRGWGVLSGVVTTLAGAVVLLYPEASVVALTWLSGIGLVLIGGAVVFSGLAARRSRTARAGATA